MPEKTGSLKFEQDINISPSQVYYAFTNSTSLREFFCDVATVDPKPGGRVYFAWNDGYYSCGEYTRTEPDRMVAFTWHGKGEPAPSQVTMEFFSSDGGVHITVEHSWVDMGEIWSKTVKEINRGWKYALDNLKSVLETGEDQRFMRRPMLGIGLNDFDEDIAKQIGVPVTEGIRIDTPLEGMGAHAAGLRSEDVIVSMGDYPITDFSDLAKAVDPYQAGDTIKVEFYRGAEKKTVSMELSHRPIPEMPTSLDDLAERVRRRYDIINNEIDEFFDGITEAEASFKPNSNEWSVKETLAHLIHSERAWQDWISNLVGGQLPHYDDYPANLSARVEATASAFETLEGLLDELRRCHTETVELVARLPKRFTERKASFWRLSYNSLEDPYHHRSHLEQMRAVIEKARERSG